MSFFKKMMVSAINVFYTDPMGPTVKAVTIVDVPLLIKVIKESYKTKNPNEIVAYFIADPKGISKDVVNFIDSFNSSSGEGHSLTIKYPLYKLEVTPIEIIMRWQNDIKNYNFANEYIDSDHIV